MNVDERGYPANPLESCGGNCFFFFSRDLSDLGQRLPSPPEHPLAVSNVA
jgi:hypothetical protein